MPRSSLKSFFVTLTSFVLVLTVLIIIFQQVSPPVLSSHLHASGPQQHFFIAYMNNKIDQPNAEDLIENVPPIYVREEDKAKLPSQYNRTCGKFPKLFDIKFTSDHWQTVQLTNGTLHLFNAYIDHRNLSDNKGAIKILAMVNEFNSNKTFYCQLWFEKVAQPVLVKSEKLIWIWLKGFGGNNTQWFHPYIISCPWSTKDRIPMSVSVVENPCDNAMTNLKISYKEVSEEEKKNFVVCVKGLNFPYDDKSLRLIEWIELLFILGAEKINFYEFNVHPTVKKLLNYYTSQGNVEVTPISLIGGASNSEYLQSQFLKKRIMERRLQEVIPYNDCLYKHLQEYKFVVILDTDEVIAPVDDTWNELLDEIKNDDRSSYMARNVYFLDSHGHEHGWFDDIPRFMHMLQHVYRAKNYTKPGSYVKGFHDTRKVVALHNHFPFKCIKACNELDIPLKLAHLQHYRTTCVGEIKDCDLMKNESVMDLRMWNYKDELIRRTTEVLTILELYK